MRAAQAWILPPNQAGRIQVSALSFMVGIELDIMTKKFGLRIRAFGLFQFLPASLAADENDEGLRDFGAVEIDVGFSTAGYHFKLAADFTDVIFGFNDAGACFHCHWTAEIY